LIIRGSFDKFGKFLWNGATIQLMTWHLERSTLSHLKRDWRAKKCSSIKTTRRLTNRPLQWQNYELGYELIPHPPHSPDLTPCDFFLFPNLKTWLGGKKFSSNEEVIIHQWVFCRLWDSLLQMTIKRELCVLSGWNLAWRVRRVDLSRCCVIKWIVVPFHGNLPNLSNDPRIYFMYVHFELVISIIYQLFVIVIYIIR